jgi:hypothetical protein
MARRELLLRARLGLPQGLIERAAVPVGAQATKAGYPGSLAFGDPGKQDSQPAKKILRRTASARTAGAQATKAGCPGSLAFGDLGRQDSQPAKKILRRTASARTAGARR